MAQPKLRLQTKTKPWSNNARFRVGDTVVYNNYQWANKSGGNSEPTVSSSDWLRGAYVGEFSLVNSLKREVEVIPDSTYTIKPEDFDKVLVFDNSSEINVTVNNDSLSEIGQSAELDVFGTGLLKINEGSANLLFNVNRLLESDGQYSRIAVQKMSSTQYRVFGELAIA